MKKQAFFALAALAVVGCSDDEFMGKAPAPAPIQEDTPVEINFGSTNQHLTRAGNKTGKEAADLLGDNFVVEGTATYAGAAGRTVMFDHYNVNYVDGSANTTESNSTGWEYVGQELHANTSVSSQTIKYWDLSSSQYDFVAFSYGTSNPTDLTLSAIDNNNIGKAATTSTPVYTVTGNAADLAKAYVADLVTVYHKDYNKQPVTPQFRNMGAKVRLAIYETVPGYSIKDVKFYTSMKRQDASGTSLATDAPALFAKDDVLPAGQGTMEVYYPTTDLGDTDYNKAHIVFTEDAAADLTSVLDLGDELSYTTGEGTEASASGTQYLGRTSSSATYATASPADAYVTVLPKGTGADLYLHVDYTLVPTDGGAGEIKVKSARAVVPALYADWQPNYAYTYIFKISKNTNGTTSGNDDFDPERDTDGDGIPDIDDPDIDGDGIPNESDPDVDGDGTPNEDDDDYVDPAGLYPITFDATVMDDMQDGIQETITTVTTPSITTYAKSYNPTTGDEYKINENIYVSVQDVNGADITLTTTNTAVYYVVLEETTYHWIDATDLVPGNTYYADELGNGAFVADGSEDPSDHFYEQKTTTAAQGIDEASVANGIANGATDNSDLFYVEDANGVHLTLYKRSIISIVDEIAAADATDGNAVPGNFAKFVPSQVGTYAFEYTDAAGKKHYKIIKTH